ncbi:phosphomannomutase/phosphoglucomutase [Patescibacteria group bacterium]|nr:MAG: phosphomannomutase/phosphoglucomutase [Patescibacteria group bacterium]
MFPAQIFKAYDIRGVYPDELNEGLAFKVGRAFAEFIRRTPSPLQGEGEGGVTVVVGRDMRASSPVLANAVIKGILEQGVNVIDVGLVSTPTFYFSVAHYGYDGGLQVSASHNPAKYNGFKMVRAAAGPISGDTGIMEIRDMIAGGAIPPPLQGGGEKGVLSKKENVIADHIAFALTQADVKKINPLKVVVDSANGMGGPLMEELFKHLPCELVPLYFELDGNFPNHEADPLKDVNNRALQEKVVETGADLGVALDGDADRVFFVDEKGKTIEPAIVRGILAQIFLREYPGATICYDVRPGKITEDMIVEAGGKPMVTKVGHSLIKEKMAETGAVFAGESSGHFFLKMPHGTFEAPEIMLLKILQELSESGKTISEYCAPLYKYFHSGEINFAVEDKQAVFVALREKYGANLKYDFDGLSFEWPDWWFNVRASNTENKMRLNLEARSESLMTDKTKEVSSFLSPL